MNKTIFDKRILLVPDKHDEEREAVVMAFGQLCPFRRIGKFWEKPELPEGLLPIVYGNLSFAHVLAEVLNLKLISPDDSLLARLDPEWTKRTIEIQPLENCYTLPWPLFIKPVEPKLFYPGVQISAKELQEDTDRLPPDTLVLISEVIKIVAEARIFVYQDTILDCAIYKGKGEKSDAAFFMRRFIERSGITMPVSYVADLALLPQGGWAILEFNAAWGAGLNGCKAESVTRAIAAATEANE